MDQVEDSAPGAGLVVEGLGLVAVLARAILDLAAGLEGTWGREDSAGVAAVVVDAGDAAADRVDRVEWAGRVWTIGTW